MGEKVSAIHLIEEKIAFLGAGIIAELWMERLISSGSVIAEQIMACDIRAESLKKLRESWGVLVQSDNIEGARFAQLIVLATPPPEIVPVLRSIRKELRPAQLVISLAAAVPVALLEQNAGDASVVRVMPNAPSLIGQGMNLVAYGRRVSATQRKSVEALLDIFGKSFEVLDSEMDYWCALCAVGPTYIFPIIEALSAAAVAKGLSREKVLFAAAQVVAGAARMAQSGKKNLGELNQLISLRTLAEEEAAKLFIRAYDDAAAKLQKLALRIGTAVAVQNE
jgi:pyrroline-5-carboxylate reductase